MIYAKYESQQIDLLQQHRQIEQSVPERLDHQLIAYSV
jgi:hypothetical protein